MYVENRECLVTGDPFVDAGGLALQVLKNKFPNKSKMELIEFVTDIYVDKWNGKIDSIQLNSKITHNSKKGKAKKIAALEYFKNLENNKLEGTSGFCRTCGNEGFLIGAGREQFCLSGSGGLVNFHHGHEKGVMICKECSEKLFFLPLIVMQMGKYLSLLHTQNENSQKYWAEITVIANLNKIGRNLSEGIIKSEYSNPKNAIFNIAIEIITKYESESGYIQLFHFTNFGSSPDCDIYLLPNPVFSFMSKALRYCRRDWFNFVKRYYHIKKSSWDDMSQTWLKKDDSAFEETEFKNNPNDVFEALLTGKTILGKLRKFYKESYQKNISISPLLAIYYLTEVKNMKQEQIDLIKRIGNTIFKQLQEDGSNKKYLTMIEGSSKAYQLRSVILRIVKKNYNNGEKDPVVTLSEYVNYLFPDGQYWGEVRDLLLIFLYELLHKENIDIFKTDDHYLADTEDQTLEI